MLSQTKDSIRQLFLKKFTAELILNSKKSEKIEGSKNLGALSEEDEIKAKLKEIISKQTSKIETQKPIIQQPKILQTQPVKVLRPINKVLPPIPAPKENQEIGETESTFDSVKSALLPSGEIDFGKITPFIRDSIVSSIECRRADEKIMIKKLGQVISTEVQLNENEINSLIKAFSEKTRIPLVEGILKARVNNLEIFAVISKFSTSKFIITKIIPQQNNSTMNPAGMPGMNRPMISQNPFAPKNSSPTLLKK